MRIILAGNKTISVKVLEWLIQQKEEICSVFIHPDKKASLNWQESLKEKCRKYNLKTYEGNINDYADLLEKQEPDILFSIQYAPLIKKHILNLPKLGCINLHNGDLPRYGGCSPVYHAVLNGEKKMAVTLHYMDENFDTGQIIGKEHLDIGENETSGDLFKKVTEAGLRLFKKQYHLIKNKKNSRIKQQGKKLYYGLNVLDFNSRKQRIIRWDDKAEDVHNKIRAFTFPERQWFPVSYLNETPVEISGSGIEDEDTRIRKYGEVIEISDGKVFVTARDGIVSLQKINNISAEKYCNDKRIRGGTFK